MNKKKILFVIQCKGTAEQSSHCGIAIRGDLVSTFLKNSQNYEIEIIHTESCHELEVAIHNLKPDMILYNFHECATPWIIEPYLRNKYPAIKHVMIHYDFTQHKIDTYNPVAHYGFKFALIDDSTLKGSNNVFIVERCIPDPVSPPILEKHTEHLKTIQMPIIGFNGFGFLHKGISKIAAKVQEEFDEAIIRLHMPYSYFGDRDGFQARQRIQEVNNILKKPGIKLEVSHAFFTATQLVEWLSQNTINCYFNDYLDGCGIASSPDYAIAARRPIAVTHSHQLRNFWNLSPSIQIEDHTLKEIISYGTEPLKSLYEKYDKENVIKSYEKAFDAIFSSPL